MSKFDLPKSVAASRKDKARLKIPRSEEDDVELARLDQLGLIAGDESKILVLREYIVKLAQASISFASRQPVEIAGAQLAKQSGSVPLQGLGVVPQTVFLNGMDPTTASPSSRQTDTSRRLSLTSDKKQSGATSHRLSRNLSSEAGNPYGDLRRKLAQIDGSSTSLAIPQSTSTRASGPVNSTGPSDVDSAGATSPRPVTPSQRPPSVAGTETTQDFHVPFHRPTSPSGESLTSNQMTFPSSGVRPSKRGLHVGDGAKAAPAVGTVHTEATGFLEAAVRLRADMESEEPSGRASPISAAGTARKDNRLRSLYAAPASTTYEGQEPMINNVLEHVYQDNLREGLRDFGPRVTQAPPRRRPTPRGAGLDSRSGNRRAEPDVIANLNGHIGSVNAIGVSPDHVFFVSCGEDKLVKVWDTARLERNVTSKPRHMYSQHHSRVTCLCMIEETHCFASAGDDGSLHVIRVNVNVAGALPKYGKLQTIREHRVDHPGEFITSMHHYNADGNSNLIYTTNLGAIVLLELRTMRILQTMTSPISHGVITCSCLERGHTWLATGTQSGMVCLWDLRFGLRLRSWRVGASSSKASAGLEASVHKIALYPSSPKRTKVIVAITPTLADPSQSSVADGSAQTLVEVWDISKTSMSETFVVDETGQPSGPLMGFARDQIPPSSNEGITAADAIAAFVRARKAELKSSGRAYQPPSTISDKDPDIRTVRGANDQDDDANSDILHDPDYEPAEIVTARNARDVRVLITGQNFGASSSFPNRSSLAFGVDSFGENHSNHVFSADEKRGFMITGSVDRNITFWDLSGRMDRSLVLSGLKAGVERPAFRTEHDATNGSLTHIEAFSTKPPTRPSQRTTVISSHQQHIHSSHQDCITALALLDSPFKGCVVSGDRAGIIKVFRIELD